MSAPAGEEEAAKRLEMLRRQLEHYNAAIQQAMGMTGMGPPEDEYADESDDEESDEGSTQSEISDAEVEKFFAHVQRENEMQRAAGARMPPQMSPQTATRNLFTDSYRESSAESAHDSGVAGQWMQSDLRSNPRLGQHAADMHQRFVPPAMRGMVFPPSPSPKGAPLPSAAAATTFAPPPNFNPTRFATPKEVERCLSSELRDVSGQPVKQSSPLAETNASMRTGLDFSATALRSPVPEAPQHTFADLENAFYRLSAVEQSLKAMSAFSMQEVALPFAERVETLRAARERLLKEDDSAYVSVQKKCEELAGLVEEDTRYHASLSALSRACDHALGMFGAVHERKAELAASEQRLQTKASRMQTLYTSLQARRREVAATEARIQRLKESNTQRQSTVQRDQAALKQQEAAIAAKREAMQELEGRVTGWRRAFNDREALLQRKEERLRGIASILEERACSIASQKENKVAVLA